MPWPLWLCLRTFALAPRRKLFPRYPHGSSSFKSLLKCHLVFEANLDRLIKIAVSVLSFTPLFPLSASLQSLSLVNIVCTPLTDDGVACLPQAVFISAWSVAVFPGHRVGSIRF